MQVTGVDQVLTAAGRDRSVSSHGAADRLLPRRRRPDRLRRQRARARRWCCPAWWVSHLEVDWQSRAVPRRSSRRSRTRRTVIRYDRLGTGLSRPRTARPSQLTLEHEVGALEALSRSSSSRPRRCCRSRAAGCIAARYAARHPVLARSSSPAPTRTGTRVAPDEVERLMIAAVRTHWGMGSRMLADLFLPGAPEEERRGVRALPARRGDAGDGGGAARAGLRDRRPRPSSRGSRAGARRPPPRRPRRARSSWGASWRRCCPARGSCRSRAARTCRGRGSRAASSS